MYYISGCFVYFFSGYVDISIGRRSEFTSTDDRNYLMFTQQWPPVSCLNWQILNPKHTCNINIQIDNWTVRGIKYFNRPSSLDKSSGLYFCNKYDPFDVNQIQSIKRELNKYWPNIHANKAEDYLWAHEWEKHGTCATTFPMLKTQLQYFQQALKWIKQFNMYSILKTSGIEPSFDNPVLAHEIETAIQKVLNVKPILECEYIKTNNSYYIYEIKICFDIDLELMDCPMNSSKRCMSNTLVWYPPIHLKKKMEPAYSMEFEDILSLLLGLLVIYALARFFAGTHTLLQPENTN
uniref:Uncharacterized protein n=1 Tax=Strigamia maritima TaxID=126957 RepID=T1IQR3_STRMM